MTQSHPPAELIQHQKASQKASLRKTMRQRRRELDPGLRTQLNSALNQLLLRRLLELQPCLVSAYLCFDGEPDLLPTLQRLREAGFKLALPFIEKSGSESRLVFRKWRQSDDLSENKLGFLEPSGGEALALEEIGVILMPLVAWDGLGARLGMGAGYYDKALAPIRDQSTPLRIGIAFDLQKSDGIPTDTHDVPLHELISDSQRFTFPT